MQPRLWNTIIKKSMKLYVVLFEASIVTLFAIITAMVKWLRFSTRIHKILYSNLSIIIHGMTLDKSLTPKLSRMTHSCRADASSVSRLDGRGADTGVLKKKKKVEISCMWILIIIAAGRNG